MILFVSGRTDIVAFYMEWFMNRYKEGFVDVRNPFNHNLVSRIKFENVDLLFFCTKNPLPIIPHLKTLKIPMLIHVTLTPYKKDIEPNVPSKKEIIEGVKRISSIIGSDNIVVRYDPIFISKKYSVIYHQKAFLQLCSLLKGYVHKIIISFIDNYKNVENNMQYLKVLPFTEEIYYQIGTSFSMIAKKYDITVQTCFENKNLVEYGFVKGDCLSKELALKLTGKNYPKQSVRKGNKCECVKMVDIGAYNTCKHLCKYCYANYQENIVENNYLMHNPKSSMLIGNLQKNDVVKERLK